MKNNFEIFGHFYELSGLKCRKNLDIKRKWVNSSRPDIMVVMMNPGSSYPLDGINNNHEASIAYPDPTQNQIMTVMDNKYNFARVLNLSDIRQPSSAEFYKFIKSTNADGIAHSLFHESRINELSALFCHDVPVIYGWGVNSNLERLAKMAMNRISAQSPIGLKKAGFEWAFYHPLPRLHSKRIEWVNSVSSLLTNSNSHHSS